MGDLRGNVRTSSIARWKARVRLPIRHNCELFSLALTVEMLQAEICRREPFLNGGGSLRSSIKGGRGPVLGGRKLEGLPFYVV